MNFLAHLHLSDGTPESMLGGVVADLVRGPDVAGLPADVQRGVRLHRLIDSFTDRHPLVQRCVARLGPTCGWFSGIVIDVYFDHILARDWYHYSDEPLGRFAGRCYAVLDAGRSLVPDDAAAFLGGFVADDRLVRYATADGLADTLARLSDRIARRIPRHPIRLEAALPVLLAQSGELSADFHTFYPELLAYARSRPDVAV
jgi:acyl carrier protein phosphodiesterase